VPPSGKNTGGKHTGKRPIAPPAPQKPPKTKTQAKTAPFAMGDIDQKNWRYVTRSVTPLPPEKRNYTDGEFADLLREKGNRPAAPLPQPPREGRTKPVPLTALPDIGAKLQQTDFVHVNLWGQGTGEKTSKLHALEVGNTDGMDGRMARKFKKGRLPVDGKLDLHGFQQHNAHQALRDFIRSRYDRGARFLIVVTGKGTRSEGGQGVLKRLVPRWLNEADMRRLIVSFSHAQPADGGEGAIYIYLKRKKV
jgi:hypothetical protein